MFYDWGSSAISQHSHSGTLQAPHIPVCTCPAFAVRLQLRPLLSPAGEILFHPTGFQLKSHQPWDQFPAPSRFPSPSSLCSNSLHLVQCESPTGPQVARRQRFINSKPLFCPFIAPRAPSSRAHQNCHEYRCCLMSSPHATAPSMPSVQCAHHCPGHTAGAQ